MLSTQGKMATDLHSPYPHTVKAQGHRELLSSPRCPLHPAHEPIPEPMTVYGHMNPLHCLRWSHLHPKPEPESKGKRGGQREFWVLLPEVRRNGLGWPPNKEFPFQYAEREYEREPDERLVELEMKEVTSERYCPSVDSLCQEVLVPLLHQR